MAEGWDMGTVRIVLRRGLARAQVEEMCGRLDAMLGCPGVEAVVCDLEAIGEPDMTVVEALMRLQLTARRRGRRILLDDPPQALLDLLSVTGLLGLLNRPVAAEEAEPPATAEAEPPVPPPRIPAPAAERPPP
jgi:ABC-type transporter Mla MlaB component